MLLGNEEYTSSKEPEKIVMKNYNLDVDGEDEPIEPAKHVSLQKLMEEFSENSSIDNGSLCELNFIPCYNEDRYSPSYYQKLKYYTTVGKDECPRIFDYNQYSFFNEPSSTPSPLKQIQFNSPSNLHEYSSEPRPIIPLNTSLNEDNNESYYSDTSMESNVNNSVNESTFYIKINTKVLDNLSFENSPLTPTPIPTLASTPTPASPPIKSFKKSFNFFKKSQSQEPTSIEKEKEKEKEKNNDDLFNFMLNDNLLTCDTIKMNDLTHEVNDLHLSAEPFNTFSSDTMASSTPFSSSPFSPSPFSSTFLGKKEEVKKNEKVEEARPKPKKRHSSISKYDFVKVLVYLSGEHYYVLSRFLVSRMLTASKIDYVHAVKIALELKKRLVDRNELELSQKKLEKTLFSIMKEYGYNEKYTSLYKLISGFYRERIPMIILISGPRCVGKSTFATKLAERLNLPNIVKTNTVYDLMCSIFDIPEEDREPLWYRNCSTDELLEKYEKECELVKKGLEADIKKAFTEGKSIIIEGTHVTHLLYDFVLECIEKFNNDKTKNNNKSFDHSTNSNYSSKLLSTDNNPCNAIVLPFYLDMEDKKCHKEFLYNQMMTETIINNKNHHSDYSMDHDFPRHTNIGNDQLCEFESKIDIIGNLFRKENEKRKNQQSSYCDSKAFKYINVEFKSSQNTLDLMHNEVLNKIQEKFSISE